MSEIYDFTKEELSVLVEVLDHWEKISTLLNGIEAWPRDNRLIIDSEMQPGYMGYISENDGGVVVFCPGPVPAEEQT